MDGLNSQESFFRFKYVLLAISNEEIICLES